jgi:sec-independent protein translocase protein TatA
MSGIFEILIVIAIILVVFGAAKLPAIGGAVGRMVRNFKAAQSTRDEIEVKSEKKELDSSQDK